MPSGVVLMASSIHTVTSEWRHERLFRLMDKDELRKTLVVAGSWYSKDDSKEQLVQMLTRLPLHVQIVVHGIEKGENGK